MNKRLAFRILVRAALADHTENRIAQLDACEAMARELGLDHEAELVWTIAANLRQADQAEQKLTELMEVGEQ
jgi:hypothetical protein